MKISSAANGDVSKARWRRTPGRTDRSVGILKAIEIRRLLVFRQKPKGRGKQTAPREKSGPTLSNPRKRRPPRRNQGQEIKTTAGACPMHIRVTHPPARMGHPRIASEFKAAPPARPPLLTVTNRQNFA